MFIALPVNAVLIGLTGATLGKAIFGVKIVDGGGAPIGIGRAFRRELHVWLVGLGLSIPIVNLICMLRAFRKLKSSGTTSWDVAQRLTVLHRPTNNLQHGLNVLGVAIILGLFTYFTIAE